MSSPAIVIVGAGLAGTRCATTLRRLAPDRPVVLLADESHAPYERPPLSKEFLSGLRDATTLTLPGASFEALRTRGIDVRPGAAAAQIEPGAVTLTDGATVEYGSLILATGARPRRLPSTAPADRVHELRSLDDARRLRAALRPGTRLVIVGSGFVGAEVASTAAAAGVTVTMVDVSPIPFARTLGSEVGTWLAHRWSAAGVDLRFGHGIDDVRPGSASPVEVQLSDGCLLPADHVLVAIGTIANDELFHHAAGTTGAIGSGIPVDDVGRTDLPRTWAAGDVTRRGSVRTEHWTDAAGAAERVARDLAGVAQAPALAPYAWSDQFGLRIQVTGRVHADGRRTDVQEGDGTLLVRYLDDRGGLMGMVGIGHPSDVARCRSELAA